MIFFFSLFWDESKDAVMKCAKNINIHSIKFPKIKKSSVKFEEEIWRRFILYYYMFITLIFYYIKAAIYSS